MNKKKVLLFTDSFPFGHYETFLEPEIKIWGQRKDVELIIFPILDISGHKRKIASNISIDTKLHKKLKKFENNIFYLFPIVFLNPFFWKELINLPIVLLKPKWLRKLIAASTFSKVICDYLRKNYKKELNSDSIFYSYWFYYAAYAGALLRKTGYDFTLITRAHGTDVFQNRKDTGNYIPFRRFQVWKYFSKIFPVSLEGKNYLTFNQNIPESKMKLANLGIFPPNIVAESSTDNTLVIVSCSNIISVKRIDLIIEGLIAYKKKYPQIDLMWHHLGDGKLFETIKKMANEQLTDYGIKYVFHEQLKNQEVLDFYRKTKIDCFVNTSISEGLPVSIMEALCSGIPVLATSVGGIPEAVDENVGCLLSKNFTTEEFVLALHKMHSFKSVKVRKQITLVGEQMFSAIKNHNKFVDTILTY